jgi:hypothetical protein
MVASSLSLLEMIFPGLHFVFNGAPSVIRVGEVAVTAIPHCHNDEDLKRYIDEARPVPGAYNILLLHIGLFEESAFAQLVPGSQQLSLRELPEGFDWIISGHFHGMSRYERFLYVGSTERNTYNEEGQVHKGYLLLDTVTNEVVTRPVPTRPMRTLPEMDASGYDGAKILEWVAAQDQELPFAGALIRGKIDNVAPEVYKTFDYDALNALGKEAAFFAVPLVQATPEAMTTSGIEAIADLGQEYSHFIDVHLAARPEAERAEILRRGQLRLDQGDSHA